MIRKVIYVDAFGMVYLSHAFTELAAQALTTRCCSRCAVCIAFPPCILSSLVEAMPKTQRKSTLPAEPTYGYEFFGP